MMNELKIKYQRWDCFVFLILLQAAAFCWWSWCLPSQEIHCKCILQYLGGSFTKCIFPNYPFIDLLITLYVFVIFAFCRRRSVKTSEPLWMHSCIALENRATSKHLFTFCATVALCPYLFHTPPSTSLSYLISVCFFSPAGSCWCWPVTNQSSLTGP